MTGRRTHDACSNPSRPCHLHDQTESWRIEVGRRHTIHAGWFVVGVVAAWFVSTISAFGLN